MHTDDFNEILTKFGSFSETEKIQALTHFEDNPSPQVLIVLLKIACTDGSLKVRFNARASLQNVKLKVSELDNNTLPDDESIIRQLKSENSKDRVKATKLLLLNSSPELEKCFLQALANEEDINVLIFMIYSYGILFPGATLTPLLPLLGHSDISIKMAVCESLGLMGSIESIKLMLSLISDTSQQVIDTVVSSLNIQSKATLLTIFGQIMASSSTSEKNNVIDSIRSIQCFDKEFILILSRGLIDPSPHISSRAEEMLSMEAEKGNTSAAELLTLFQSDKNHCSYDALYSRYLELNDQGDLWDRFRNSDWEAQCGVLSEAMSSEKNPILDELKKGIEQEDDPYIIAGFLSHLFQNPEMAEPFRDLLISSSDNKNARIRANAIEVLGKILPDQEKYLLFKAIHDENNRVRANALIALSNYPYFNADKAFADMIDSADSLSMKKSLLYAAGDIAKEEFLPKLEEFHARESDRDLIETAGKVIRMLESRSKKTRRSNHEKSTSEKSLSKESSSSTVPSKYSSNEKIRHASGTASGNRLKPHFLRTAVAIVTLIAVVTYYFHIQSLEISPEAQNLYKEALNTANFSREDSISRLEKALELAPNFLEAKLALAKLHLAKGNTDEAIRYFHEVASRDPKNHESRFKLGILFSEMGKFSKAIKQFEEFIALNPNDPKAHFNLGLVYHKEGKADAALASFFQASEIKRNYPEAYYNIANIYIEKGLPDKALEYLFTCLRYEPNFTDANKYIAKIYYDMGKLPEAMKHIDLAISALDSDPESLLLKAGIIEKSATAEADIDWKSIITLLTRALALDSKNTETKLQLALAEEKAGKFAEALEHFTQVSQQGKYSTDSNILFKIGLLHHRGGDKSSAVRYYKSAIRANDDFAEAYHNLGLAYMEEGNTGMAKTSFQKALEKDPENEVFKKSLETLTP